MQPATARAIAIARALRTGVGPRSSPCTRTGSSHTTSPPARCTPPLQPRVRGRFSPKSSARFFTSSRPHLQQGPYDNPLRAQLSHILSPETRGKSTDKRLTISLDSAFVSIDHLHLRDACTCSLCVDPSTKQKLFQTHDIPPYIRAKEVKTSPVDNSVRIIWSTDFMGVRHVSNYTAEQLRILVHHRASVRARYDDLNYVLWDKAVMEKDAQFVPYKDYMENDETLLFTLQQLVVYGLVFLKEVPQDPESVARIAERVGNIKETFYGRTWDVKSVPDSKNIAYTSLNLGLHMDLLYFESPPGLQFLHCLNNTVTGGNSYFSDSFRAAELIRMNSPNSFTFLTSFPVNFHYHNDDEHYFYIRPTVVLAEHGYQNRKRIDHINYSPPFQAPFDVPNLTETPSAVSQWRQFFAALNIFGNIVDDKANQYELKLKEGECVIFQNRRVLHARREFDPKSGDRWLKGTYVDGDVYRSKLRVLMEKFQKKHDNLGTSLEYSYIK